MTQHTPLHGGADALGAPLWDFSTNSNAASPCPHTLAALAQADASRYPDPGYTQLRAALAAWHGVHAQRIVIGASGSELIARITCWIALCARARHVPARVWLPAHAYGDYAHAARQYGLPLCHDVAQAELIWLCAPTSPHGQALQLPTNWAQRSTHCTVVLDCAYAPLQLSEAPIDSRLERDSVWQIWTPNKALGLCGIRAAYAIAPAQAPAADLGQIMALAPSWPVGSHGVALLHSWCAPATQAWLEQARHTLRQWKHAQIELLQSHGWQCLPSQTNFLVARPPLPHGQSLPGWLAQLRQQGIKLRDAASFGLPGWVRLCVHTPAAQAALQAALAQQTNTRD